MRLVKEDNGRLGCFGVIKMKGPIKVASSIVEEVYAELLHQREQTELNKGYCAKTA